MINMIDYIAETPFLHERAMGKHEFTRLNTAQTWGSHHLPPYSILIAWP